LFQEGRENKKNAVFVGERPNSLFPLPCERREEEALHRRRGKGSHDCGSGKGAEGSSFEKKKRGALEGEKKKKSRFFGEGKKRKFTLRECVQFKSSLESLGPSSGFFVGGKKKKGEFFQPAPSDRKKHFPHEGKDEGVAANAFWREKETAGKFFGPRAKQRRGGGFAYKRSRRRLQGKVSEMKSSRRGFSPCARKRRVLLFLMNLLREGGGGEI